MRGAVRVWKSTPKFTNVSNAARTEGNFADWLEKQDHVVQLWNPVGGNFGGAHLRLDMIYLDDDGNFVGMEMKIHKSDDYRKPTPKDTILRHLIDAGFLDENEIECTHYPSFNCAIFEWRPSQEVVKILGLQSNEDE